MQTDKWHISRERSLKFAMLGYPGSGKTYYLGSLYGLKINLGPGRFSVRGRDFSTIGRIEETYRILTNKQLGAIFTTKDSETIDLIFKKGLTDLFDVQIIDFIGESIQPERKIEEAMSVLKNINEVDGIFITIKAPENYQEAQNTKRELLRIIELVKMATQKNKNISVALVLTQIDKLSQLAYIENETIEKIESNYSTKMNNSIELNNLKNETINSRVKEVISIPYIENLITTFYNIFEMYNISCRVFPSTSVGFDIKLNTSNNIFNPYGTSASFLWMVYSSILVKPMLKLMLDRSFDVKQIKDELLYIYSSGQAYSDSDSEIWSTRNIEAQ